MVLQFLPHPDISASDSLRAGFTVTKKQGNAVIRNRIRRRLKEALRLAYAERPVHGWDVVVIGRRGGLDFPFDIIMEDMRYALRRLAKHSENKGRDHA